jgi:hypothetical protein
MSIKLFSATNDDVVEASVGIGTCAYGYALSSLLPLVDRLGIQRRVQDPKFYDRLKRDILDGCVMPPITIAFLHKAKSKLPTSRVELSAYCNANISQGFVLDGIQRLNTLKRASADQKLDRKRTLFVNVVVCCSMDSLLYRMITLNNGQRPMTMRHQIEILMTQMDLSKASLSINTEKDGGSRKKGYFRQADVVLAYLAFLAGSTTVDTQKLIEQRLDEILASQVQETPPRAAKSQFFDALKLIEQWSENDDVQKWFKTVNNLIGFCAGARRGLPAVRALSSTKFNDAISVFEDSFSAFDVSKIKLGQVRRDCLKFYIENYAALKAKSALELTDQFAKLTA